MKTASPSRAVQRVRGAAADSGKLPSLDKDRIVRAIKITGNYCEMYERNWGPKQR